MQRWSMVSSLKLFGLGLEQLEHRHEENQAEWALHGALGELVLPVVGSLSQRREAAEA